MNSKYNLLVILGPTASGKTALAASWAARNGGEVISADSRQVYRGMTLGTGKDLDDYWVDGQQVLYHLIDLVDAGYHYNVYEYQQDFLRAYHDVCSREHIPVLCGGSGLYLEAVLSGYRLISVPPDEAFRKSLQSFSDEELAERLARLRPLHNRSDTENRKRLIRALEIAAYQEKHPETDASYPSLRSLIVGTYVDRESRRKLITSRLHQRLRDGMIEEVEALHRQGLSWHDLEYYGLEYKYIAGFLSGQISRDTMEQQLNIAIHQFAKRQMTWFRKMEREGFAIHWVDASLPMSEKTTFVDALFFNTENQDF